MSHGGIWAKVFEAWKLAPRNALSGDGAWPVPETLRGLYSWTGMSRGGMAGGKFRDIREPDM